MPFIDLNNGIPEFLPEADVVVVGAGAAGILLALRLSAKGKKVLLLESGHFFEDEHRQELNAVEQSGKFLSNAVWGRKRAIGGTTIAWGGQSLPFSALDFEKRDWVCNSGWPLTYFDLHHYYKQANEFMRIDSIDYYYDVLKLLGMQNPRFDNQLLNYHFSKWAPEPDFKKLYKSQLEQSVTILYNAVLKKIVVDVQGNAEMVEVTNFKDDVYVFKTPKLVLAAGGIETNRILLSNRHQVSVGIGNHSGWLGKCFMDHPCIKIGSVTTYKPYHLQRFFNTHIKNRLKYSVRLSASEALQQEHKMLNGSASIMFDYTGEEFDPYTEIRRFIKSRKINTLQGMAGNFDGYLFSAYAYAIRHFIYKHKAKAKVVLMLEQEPIRESYIALSDHCDRFGVPKALINWKVNHKTWDTVIRMSSVLKEELNRLSFGDVLPEPYIMRDNRDWEDCLTDVNHHMGGVRMSASAADGVVNKHLQVWGHDNLYVCSTAVFPTGSHSNPTLTLLALAEQLADKLGSE